MRYRTWFVFLVFLMIHLWPLSTTASTTTNIVVDSLADTTTNDGYCTLREAVEAANMNTAVDTCPAGSLLQRDTITFSVNGTILLSSELTVSGGITLIGNGQTETILDGQGVTRVLHLDGSGRGVVELYDLTIQNGMASQGGGIYDAANDQSLLLDSVTVQDNLAVDGGGLFFIAEEMIEVTIRHTIFANNEAFEDGGAIMGWGYECQTCEGQLTIESSLFLGNIAAINGGAVAVQGGLFTLSHSTLTANQADVGAAIYGRNHTTSSVNNTISGNVAASKGGAMYLVRLDWEAELYSRNNTLVNNVPQNLYFVTGFKGISPIFTNTILANNGFPNCVSEDTPIITLGHNLTDNNDCGFDDDTDVIVTPAIVQQSLGSLAENGGPTPTHALLPGSPAIDAGSCNPAILYDQRGVSRPQGDECDIGAFEYKDDYYKLFLPIVEK